MDASELERIEAITAEARPSCDCTMVSSTRTTYAVEMIHIKRRFSHPPIPSCNRIASSFLLL
jgi:hypothetical protein